MAAVVSTPDINRTSIGLDVGTKRVGVAHSVSNSLAMPLLTLPMDDDIMATIKELVTTENALVVVVGYPRDMQGNETAQSRYAADFADRLQAEINIPVHLRDEAVTSIRAEEMLQEGGRSYEKADIDACAAAIILEDYLRESLV